MRAVSPPTPRSFAPDPDCPHCEGRGWELSPDGGAGSARRCGCQESSDLARLLEVSGLPERYRNLSLDRFDIHQTDPNSGGKEQLLGARRHSKAYVESFVEPGAGITSSGLLYFGPAGTGKTHLAAAVLVEIIRRYRIHGRFVDFTSLVRRIQNTWDSSSQESQNQVMAPVINTRLLVLDELGAQKPTEWVLNVLYEIINTRYGKRLPTLFTTNYSLGAVHGPAMKTHNKKKAENSPDGQNLDRGADQPKTIVAPPLEMRIGARLMSRLYEMAKPIRMTAVEDFRRNVKSTLHRF